MKCCAHPLPPSTTAPRFLALQPELMSMTLPRPSLTLTLLQAREATMAFFRPALNAHDLTEQQWRVIRILRQQGELESHQLADQACPQAEHEWRAQAPGA